MTVIAKIGTMMTVRQIITIFDLMLTNGKRFLIDSHRAPFQVKSVGLSAIFLRTHTNKFLENFAEIRIIAIPDLLGYFRYFISSIL